MELLQNKNFSAFNRVKFGHYNQNKSGLSVFLLDKGMPVGIKVLGGGPASREIELCKPLTAAQSINAIVLAGGSAFGLGASNGVMQFLAEKKIGVDVIGVCVPLVAQADIFDLHYSESTIPTADWAYQACLNSQSLAKIESADVGVSAGATVGKLAGMQTATKTRLGIATCHLGELSVGAVVVVNAVGEIVKDGNILAGIKAENGEFISSEKALYSMASSAEVAGQNTTLAIIFTNAKFAKVELCKIAEMATQGMIRAIRPIATAMDGDTVFAVSTGEVMASADVIGTMAASALESAIHDAARQ